MLGLVHDLQWKDTSGGDLRGLLSGLLAKEDAELIGEEATGLPTTVAQHLACRLGKPWLNVDMNDFQRHEAGIYGELAKRGCGPLFDDNGDPAGMSVGYLTHADGVRENYWVSQIVKCKPKSVIVLCGVAHLSPLIGKLRRLGHEAEEINVCKFDWSIKEFGEVRIVEADGRRWSEHYAPGKQP